MSKKLLKKDISIKEENKENFKESIIERKNLTNEFTVASIEKHLKTLEKMKDEGEGTMGIAQATANNVLRNNDWIKEMDKEKQHAIWLFYDNMQIVDEIKPQLDAVKEEIEVHNSYLDTIYDAFGFKNEVVIDLKKDAEEKGS
jgi:hypothetical protein